MNWSFNSRLKTHVHPALTSYDSLFIFVKNEIPQATLMIQEIDHQYKFPDGFLHLVCSVENAFGS